MTSYDTHYESFQLDKHLRALISSHYLRLIEEIEGFPNHILDEDSLNSYEQAINNQKETT